MNEKKNLLLNIPSKKLSILIAGILGIILISLSAFVSSTKDDSIIKSGNELEVYISNMEKKLCEIISQIDGAGKTNVFITAENSFETIYASNASIDESGKADSMSKTTQKKLAYYSNGSNTEIPVIIKQKCPEICGVLIVCEGGSDKKVRNEIINSVSTSIGIQTNKIYVTGGNN